MCFSLLIREDINSKNNIKIVKYMIRYGFLENNCVSGMVIPS